MAAATVIYTKKNHVARITLNRPETGNIINQQLAQELVDICRGINQDDDIYVVVITGAGDRVFCGGSELERLIQGANTVEVSSAKLKDAGTKYNVATSVASIDRPVIAAINGDALGWGLELALSCDIRLAVDKARFGLPQLASGLIPMDGGTQRLPRIVGRGKALELILTARTISAEEACEIGLVTKVVAQEKLAAEVETLARAIAGKAPIALRYAKEAINKGLDLTLEQGLRLEADLYFLLHTTSDRTEGIKAFLEKRAAQFRGR
ncbi:MAG: enoyl-CoA hydratase/isomerase family protein [Chloroflexi bacterium]|nr:enoyl-CoA hydratase/isomerase family protein [Chloroflexota bacterium]